MFRIVLLRSSLALLLPFLLSNPSAAAAAARPAFAPDVVMLFGTINAERSAGHLRPLQLDFQLCRVAYDHALDMVRRSYFDHSSPDGKDPAARMRAAHVRFGYMGENLGLDADARRVSRDLWLSQEHRSNLLGAHYRRVGIAAVRGPEGEIVVEDFSD